VCFAKNGKEVGNQIREVGVRMSLEVQIRKKLNSGTMLNVSFEVSEGNCALLGESGSGKSAVLRCIAGLETPEEGRIVLDGEVLYDSLQKINLPPQKRRIGYLFSGYALFPDMTVEENLHMAFLAGGRDAMRQETIGAGSRTALVVATNNYLHDYHLDGLGGYYPEELSLVQQQRAAMARLMAATPRLVLLDDPFQRLNAYQKADMLEEVRDLLAGKKLPCVFASEDRDEVYAMGGSICVLHDGRSQMAQKKDDFFRHPETISGALLAGVRNVVNVRMLNEYHAVSDDWGIVFCFREKETDRLEDTAWTGGKDNASDNKWEDASAADLKDEKPSAQTRNEATPSWIASQQGKPFTQIGNVAKTARPDEMTGTRVDGNVQHAATVTNTGMAEKPQRPENIADDRDRTKDIRQTGSSASDEGKRASLKADLERSLRFELINTSEEANTSGMANASSGANASDEANVSGKAATGQDPKLAGQHVDADKFHEPEPVRWKKLPADLAAVGIRAEDFLVDNPNAANGSRTLADGSATGSSKITNAAYSAGHSSARAADAHTMLTFSLHEVRIEESLDAWKVTFKPREGGTATMLWQVPKSTISRSELEKIHRLYLPDAKVLWLRK
jgi:molybdate transport system ATP-binding protein